MEVRGKQLNCFVPKQWHSRSLKSDGLMMQAGNRQEDSRA